MRKTLAVLICALLLLPSLCVGVNAAAPVDIPAPSPAASPAESQLVGSVALNYSPSATAVSVSSALEFAAMKGDGDYYLTADIAVTQTFGTKAEDFTGTLDGCGHTITLNGKPMFYIMNGTVKNLIIEGYVVRTDAGDIGAIAMDTLGGGVFTNILNKADVSNTVDISGGSVDGCTGGLVGLVDDTDINNQSAAKFTKCRNEGAVTGPEATGGIAGESQVKGTTFTDCSNGGKVTSKCEDSGTCSGGILGYSGTNTVTVTHCANSGVIKSSNCSGGIAGDTRKGSSITYCSNSGSVTAKGYAGGIIGQSADSTTTAKTVVDYCYNSGSVTSEEGAAGGLAGYVYGRASYYLMITNSVNVGTITGKTYVSEFIGYTNSAGTTLSDCVGMGALNAVSGASPRFCLFGCSSAAVQKCTIEDVILIDGGKTEWYTWAPYSQDDANASSRIPLTAILDSDLSGTEYTYEVYSDDKNTVVSTGNKNKFVDSAETPVKVKKVTRATAATQAMVDKLNAASQSPFFYLVGDLITTDDGMSGGETGDGAVFYAAAGILAIGTLVYIFIPARYKRQRGRATV